MKNSYTLFSKKSAKTIAIVAGSMTVAFMVGIQSAGDVHLAVGSTKAGSAAVEGDLNSNSIVDLGDIKIALELAQGYRTPTPGELDADPNQDFQITVEDALAIVNILQRQPAAGVIEP